MTPDVAGTEQIRFVILDLTTHQHTAVIQQAAVGWGVVRRPHIPHNLVHVRDKVTAVQQDPGRVLPTVPVSESQTELDLLHVVVDRVLEKVES